MDYAAFFFWFHPFFFITTSSGMNLKPSRTVLPDPLSCLILSLALNISVATSKVATPHKNVHKNLHSVDKILSEPLFVHQIAQFVDKASLKPQLQTSSFHPLCSGVKSVAFDPWLTLVSYLPWQGK